MLTPEEQRNIDTHYRAQNAREDGCQEAVESCAGDPAEVHKFTYPVLAIDQAYSEALKRIAKLESDLAALQAKVALARSALRAAKQGMGGLARLSFQKHIDEAMQLLDDNESHHVP